MVNWPWRCMAAHIEICEMDDSRKWHTAEGCSWLPLACMSLLASHELACMSSLALHEL